MIIRPEVNSVKKYREIHECGLVEAKEAILKDQLLNRLQYIHNLNDLRDVLETLIHHTMRG